MVKDAVRRIDKYQKKFDPAIVKKQLTGLKPMMDMQAQDAFAQMVAIEEATKAVLACTDVRAGFYVFYLDFVRALAKKARRFSGRTLILEAERIRKDWIERGLDGNILSKIRNEVFAIPLP